MTCYRKYCPWRSDDTSDVYHCDCAFACPNRDSGETYFMTDHTESQKGEAYWKRHDD